MQPIWTQIEGAARCRPTDDHDARLPLPQWQAPSCLGKGRGRCGIGSETPKRRVPIRRYSMYHLGIDPATLRPSKGPLSIYNWRFTKRPVGADGGRLLLCPLGDDAGSRSAVEPRLTDCHAYCCVGVFESNGYHRGNRWIGPRIAPWHERHKDRAASVYCQYRRY